MHQDVTQWTRIRRCALTGGVSQRRIARETGMSRETVRKMIEFSFPPGYRRKKAVDRPKLGPLLGFIDHIVTETQGKFNKQQHTASQIWEWLKEKHGFTGGYSIVKDYVREARRRAVGDSKMTASKQASVHPTYESEDPALLIYELIQSLPKRDAIRLLRVMFEGGPPRLDLERLNRLVAPLANKDTRGVRRLRAKQLAFDWMRKVLQCEASFDALAGELGELLGNE